MQFVMIWLAIAILFALTVLNLSIALALVRERKQTAQDLGGPTVGSEMPPFQLPDIEGGLKSNQDYLGREYLLVMTTSTCSACESLIEDMEARLSQASQRSDRGIVLVWHGDLSAQARDKLAGMQQQIDVLLQGVDSQPLGAKLGFTGAPSYCMVSPDGSVLGVGLPAADVEPLFSALDGAPNPSRV